jgi:hypothetical protein
MMADAELIKSAPLIVGAAMTMAGAIALGHFLSKTFGAAFLFVLSLIASAICFLGVWLYGRPGLIAAMIVVTALAAMAGWIFSKQRGAWCFSVMWVSWCALGLFGYATAHLAGVFLITLATAVAFWINAYRLTQRLLPLSDKASQTERRLAFRALLTYTLGRNYPYYTVENRKATQQAPGNVYSGAFAGPGIVITSCDQAVVIWDGIKIKGTRDPGLSFTDKFETIAEVIDLRTQLRAFDAEVITKDGIRIKVLTFVPFRINAGRWPASGESFPFKKSAVFQVVQGQVVERTQERKEGKVVENKQKRAWDENVKIVATQAIRRIVAEYTFDDLCAPYQPQKNPRLEIRDKLRQQLKEELLPKGIEALSGGISNLLPVDDQLLQQRIGNWQAEWERKIAEEMGRGEAEYIRMVESARAQAQAEMIRTISEGFERAGAIENISTEVIALRFVEALEKIIQSPDVRQALPPASAETVEAMKRSFESHRR